MDNRSTGSALFTIDDGPALGFVLVGLIGVIATLRWPPAEQHRYETLVVIFTTILLAGLIQVLTRIGRYFSEGSQRRQFHRFFGATTTACGVLPDLVCEGNLRPRWRPVRAKEAHPDGLLSVIPFEDMHAAIQVAALFERFGVAFTIGRSNTIEEHQTPMTGFVTFGLGFNHVTYRLAEHTDLFRIEYNDSYTNRAKDDFWFDGDRHPEPTDDCDFAIIVRVPLEKNDRVVPGFVCAGRSAGGTAAAGEYLRNHWHKLYEHYINEGQRFDVDVLAVMLRHGDSTTSAEEIRHCFSPYKSHRFPVQAPCSQSESEAEKAQV